MISENNEPSKEWIISIPEPEIVLLISFMLQKVNDEGVVEIAGSASSHVLLEALDSEMQVVNMASPLEMAQ